MTSSELNRKIRKLTGDTVILMFSGGKESICYFYELKKYFNNIILVYQYLHPDLTFVNNTLDYFETEFGQRKIYRIPHAGLFRMINDYLFQTPEMTELTEAFDLPNHTYEEYYDCLREDFKCPDAFVATGVRAGDSPTRRMSIVVNGPISKHKRSFFPIFDWSNDDIRASLRENNVRLPVDYEIWGKSFDGIDYRFIRPLKDRFPEDYEKPKEIFPLLDLEILRYEQI